MKTASCSASTTAQVRRSTTGKSDAAKSRTDDKPSGPIIDQAGNSDTNPKIITEEMRPEDTNVTIRPLYKDPFDMFFKNFFVFVMLIMAGCSHISANGVDNICGPHSLPESILKISYEKIDEPENTYQVYIRANKTINGYHLNHLGFDSSVGPRLDIWLMQRAHSDYFDQFFSYEQGAHPDQFAYAVFTADSSFLKGDYCVQADYENNGIFQDAAIVLKLKN